jgi:subtilisin family serine protease
MRTPLALLVVLLCALTGASAAAAAPDPLRSQQWGLDTVEADAAHATSTGSGAVVAVVDSGVLASHEDLAGRLLQGHDFVQNDATPQDENGHGTHVTGIIAADAGNGVGIEGVAPGTKVLPIRVLGANGSGTTANVAKGIDFAVAHHADVINMSLGGDAISTVVGSDPAVVDAVNRAIAAGVVVVAAAGNDSLPYCEQPQTKGKMLCVGAIDSRGQRSFYSSTGDLVAPGGSGLGGSSEDILSTWTDGKYADLAGTSQATPHVAGVAALLVSLGLHGKQVVDRILATATNVGLPGYGAGVVNARAAVAGLGGGSGGGGGGGGGGAAGSITFRATQKIATVLKKGVRARCHALTAGRCSVRVSAGGHTIARGSVKVAAGGTVTVVARVTKAGRRFLGGRRRVNATFSGQAPGVKVGGTLTLVR